MATLRRDIVIGRSAADVWDVVGRPELLHHWFPGIVDCTVTYGDDGTATRIITTGSGIPMPETIVTNDSLQRRFQYRITAPLFASHLATVDVIEVDESSCVVAYSTEAEPSVMALVIGGGTSGALAELRRQMEAGDGPAITAARQTTPFIPFATTGSPMTNPETEL
ncbi:MAG TPA: SRPBCC family protein [Ilumatobacteraceae bacterium]|nr:SRPBCC family protein [Ilumatobacteraceae bacterium]